MRKRKIGDSGRPWEKGEIWPCFYHFPSYMALYNSYNLYGFLLPFYKNKWFVRFKWNNTLKHIQKKKKNLVIIFQISRLCWVFLPSLISKPIIPMIFWKLNFLLNLCSNNLRKQGISLLKNCLSQTFLPLIDETKKLTCIHELCNALVFLNFLSCIFQIQKSKIGNSYKNENTLERS